MHVILNIFFKSRNCKKKICVALFHILLFKLVGVLKVFLVFLNLENETMNNSWKNSQAFITNCGEGVRAVQRPPERKGVPLSDLGPGKGRNSLVTEDKLGAGTQGGLDTKQKSGVTAAPQRKMNVWLCVGVVGAEGRDGWVALGGPLTNPTAWLI